MSRMKTFLAGLLLATVAAAAPAQAGVIFQTDFSSATGPSLIKDFAPSGGSFAGSTGVINNLHGDRYNARIQASATGPSDPAADGTPTGLMVLSGIAVQPGATGYTLDYSQYLDTSASYTLSYQFYSDPAGPDAGGWLHAETRGTTMTDTWQDAGSYSIGGATGDFLAFKWEAAAGSASRFDNITVTAVPEPTSLAFAGIACGAAAFARRRHKKNSQKATEATPETATA